MPGRLPDWRRACAGTALAIALAAVAHQEVSRIASGNWFALQLPGEQPLSPREQLDAKVSAARWRVPAMLVAGTIGALAATPVSRGAPHVRTHKFSRWTLTAAMALAAAGLTADLVTTIGFFQHRGIDL